MDWLVEFVCVCVLGHMLALFHIYPGCVHSYGVDDGRGVGTCARVECDREVRFDEEVAIRRKARGLQWAWHVTPMSTSNTYIHTPLSLTCTIQEHILLHHCCIFQDTCLNNCECC